MIPLFLHTHKSWSPRARVVRESPSISTRVSRFRSYVLSISLFCVLCLCLVFPSSACPPFVCLVIIISGTGSRPLVSFSLCPSRASVSSTRHSPSSTGSVSVVYLMYARPPGLIVLLLVRECARGVLALRTRENQDRCKGTLTAGLRDSLQSHFVSTNPTTVLIQSQHA